MADQSNTETAAKNPFPQDVAVAEGGAESESPRSSNVSGGWSKKKIEAPSPSRCCIAVFVICIVICVALLTYYSVWDNEKTFKHWTERFFASEKKIDDAAKKGEITMVDYDVGNWIFLVLLSIIFVINFTIAIPAMVVILRRRCKSRKRKLETARNLADKPAIDAIVPCYLPNEAEIIEETIMHILNNVESPGVLKLWVVYNTPKDMPDIEGRLKALSERVDLPHRRKLTVVRAETSRSKAENINLLLPRITGKYVVIYDADHHPDPPSLMLMVEKMIRKNMTCIQGSTYIRDLNSGLTARIVDAEFFVTHFIYFPIMKMVTRNAVFCGSNGLWKADALRGNDFDKSMQCEDIDLSVRMLLQGHSVDFCPEARSGELAPVNLAALWKQRTRWAIGWDQVSLKVWSKIVNSEEKSTRKTAVAYVLWSRWWMQIVGLVGGVVTPLLVFIQRFDSNLCHCGLATQFVQTYLFYFYLTMLAGSTLEAMFQTHHRGLQSWLQVPFVMFFMWAGCVYVLFQFLLIQVSLFRIFTGRVGGWVVTKRAGKTSAEAEGISNTPEDYDDAPSSKEEAENSPMRLGRSL